VIANIYTVRSVAQRVKRCEQTIRNLESEGVVVPVRDSQNRRLYTEGQIKAIEAYLAYKSGKVA
jgi:DNA-binding transcriptional MerR regulator